MLLGFGGLLFEFIDAAVLIGIHDTEAARLLDRHIDNGDGGGSVHLLVVVEHGAIVHLIDVVAGEDEHIVGIIAVDEVEVLVDGIGRALVPVGGLAALIRRQHHDTAAHAVKVPRLAVADILIEHQRLILGQYADGIDA